MKNTTRVCSNHFVNAAGRQLKKDEVPSENLPRVNSAHIGKPRKVPKKRYATNSKDVMDMEGASDVNKYVEVATNTTDSLSQGMSSKDMAVLKEENARLFHEIENLKANIMLQQPKFRLDCIANDDNKVSFYTGFTTFAHLKACYDFLGPAVHRLYSSL